MRPNQWVLSATIPVANVVQQLLNYDSSYYAEVGIAERVHDFLNDYVQGRDLSIVGRTSSFYLKQRDSELEWIADDVNRSSVTVPVLTAMHVADAVLLLHLVATNRVTAVDGFLKAGTVERQARSTLDGLQLLLPGVRAPYLRVFSSTVGGKLERLCGADPFMPESPWALPFERLREAYDGDVVIRPDGKGWRVESEDGESLGWGDDIGPAVLEAIAATQQGDAGQFL